MKLSILLVFMFLCSCATTQNKLKKSPIQAKLIKETVNLAHCESVIYDSKRKLLYVSVQAGAVDADGSIAIVSLDGKVLNPNFITALNNPKGLALLGNKLYVSDVTKLIEINVDNGSIVNKYKGKGAKFLNDVTIDNQGNVYVSDMHNSSIYKLDKNKQFKKWLESPELENPNGLLAIGNTLYIASWGNYTDENPGKSPPGRFLKLNIADKKITPITTKALGHLDGLQVYDENSFLISAWLEGAVYHTTKEGVSTELIDTEQSVGDILYIAKKSLLVLPMNKQNKLMFYSVK